MSQQLGQVLAELEIAKSTQDLQKIVSILHFNQKVLSKRDSKIMDVITFGIVESLIKSFQTK
jgi:hypothetical protein